MPIVLLRLDCHARERPSGDHTGCPSNPGSKVNRVLAPEPRSTIQMSELFGWRESFSTTAALLPSGETFIVPYGPRSPGRPAISPWRLNQVSCRLLPDSDRYTSAPV